MSARDVIAVARPTGPGVKLRIYGACTPFLGKNVDDKRLAEEIFGAIDD